MASSSGAGPSAEGGGKSFRHYLAAHRAEIVELLTQWDEDGDGEISKREFWRGWSVLEVIALANGALSKAVSREEVNEVFDEIDLDGAPRRSPASRTSSLHHTEWHPIPLPPRPRARRPRICPPPTPLPAQARATCPSMSCPPRCSMCISAR